MNLRNSHWPTRSKILSIIFWERSTRRWTTIQSGNVSKCTSTVFTDRSTCKTIQNIFEFSSAASANQLDLARVVVERTVMARVYHNALYPNGDGDVYRDQLLHDHIKKLAKVVTPNHKDLRIPKVYHYECPWPWAQAELAVISAYKTPRDKLQCVFRCATTIMNLLSMASERGIPAADDLIPVLVYVIIKVCTWHALS